MPVETTVRLVGGPLAKKTVTSGAVQIGTLLRLTRPSGSLVFYRVTDVDPVPNRTTFVASAKFEPLGDGRNMTGKPRPPVAS